MTRSLSRRNFIKKGLTAGAVISAPMINFGSFEVFAQSTKTYSTRTLDIMKRSLVMDMLSLVNSFNGLMESGDKDASYDLPKEHVLKMKASGINVFHPAVGLGGPGAKNAAIAFFMGHTARIASRPDLFMRIDSLKDLEAVRTNGKLGILLGIQNSDHFENVDDVNRFYQFGQRISQLTYNSQNRIGSGSTDRRDGGISSYGVEIIERMNDVGMAVDVSHCGDRTTLEAFEVSKKPVLITHSNVRNLVGGHVRAKPDDIIKKMAENGSAMGITAVRMFVREKEPTTIEHFLDHFDYVRDLVGVQHLGLGSDMDMDGSDDMKPEYKQAIMSGYKDSYAFRDKIDTDGFDTPTRTFDLVEGLIGRGYSDQDIEGILGGNFKRVLSQIWKE